MSVFQVTTEFDDPRMRDLIPVVYPGQFHQVSDRAWLLQTSDTAQQVAQKLGVPEVIGHEPDPPIFRFIVVRLAPSYWGWSQTETWDWLKSAFQKDGAV